MSIVCLFSSCTAVVARRLLVFSVCCCLSGCAWIADFVSPVPDLGRGLADIAETAKGMRDVAKAAKAAARPIGQLREGMDSLGDLATELGSMPLPAGAAAAQVSCDLWNSREFFESAVEGDVSRCPQAGADVNEWDFDRGGLAPLQEPSQ